MSSEAVEKTEDKKQIEEEEREKMLNEENKKQDKAKEADQEKTEANGVGDGDGKAQDQDDAKVSTGEVERKRKVLEEATKSNEKGRIPIGGIRMPGFLTRRKDKTKSDPDPEEGVDLLEGPASKGADGDKAAGTAAAGGRGEEGAAAGGARRILRLRGLKLPTVNMPPMPNLPNIPNIKISNPFGKKKDKDVETGLTSASTPGEKAENGVDHSVQDVANGKKDEKISEDKKIIEEVKAKDVEDGMETVQLDEVTVESDTPATETALNLTKGPRILWDRFMNFEHKLALGFVFVFALLVLILISVAVSGPRRDFVLGPTASMDRQFALASSSCGMVQGLMENGAYTFRGIPFARPPVGDLRWRPAQPLDNLDYCWNGTFIAHNASNYCWQILPDGTISGDEDCLTLDVYTPEVKFENLLPVVVVVGSTHMTGGSTTPLLQPSAALAHAKEVVFVRPNFRLGIMGFLAAKELSRTVHPQTSGNYGLSDIKEALQWVKLNIHNFGGDPNAVTVLGYRAGATLVTALTASPAAKDLIKRVWVTSGSADFPGKDLYESEQDYNLFLNTLQCNGTRDPKTSASVTANCLRSFRAEELVEKTPSEWRPASPDLPINGTGPTSDHQWLVLDGDLLRTNPFEVWGAWERNSSITFVIGATAHADASPELYRNVSDGNETAIEKHIRASALSNLSLADEAIQRYNSSWSGLASLVSDLRTVCPLYTLATKIPNSAHFYVTTFPISVSKSEAELEYQEPMAELGVDVAAIMGRVEGSTPEERRYINAIQQLFYHFVRFGKVQLQGQDQYSGTLIIDQDTLPKKEYPNCNFWIQKDAVPRFGHRN